MVTEAGNERERMEAERHGGGYGPPPESSRVVLKDFLPSNIGKLVTMIDPQDVPDADPTKVLYHNFKELYKEVEREVVKSMLRKHIREQLKKGIAMSLEAQTIVKANPSVFSTPDQESGWTFITVGAKEGIDPKKFVETFQKMVSSKKGLEIAEESYFSLEQRAEHDQDPYGWHIHYLVRFRDHVAKSTRIKSIYQGMKKYLAAANYVDYRKVRTSELDKERVYNYISGVKSKDKMEKVTRDQKLRTDMDLPNIFSVNPW